MDENRKELVNSGAKSYCLLVRALERSFHHSSKDNANRSNTENYSAKCHTLHQMNLCNNLNIIMGELFQELITSAKDLSFELPSVNDNKILKLPELPELTSGSLLENYIKLENRFTNICNYLSALLRYVYFLKSILLLLITCIFTHFYFSELVVLMDKSLCSLMSF